jgi:hypothetical protein
MTTINETKKIIEFCTDMKKKNVNIPALLIGHQGVGKTQLVEQLAHDLGYNFVVLNVANQTPEDLLGQIDGKGGYHQPNWISNDDRPTIYFLDEFNRGQKYVLQCMFNFINEGRIHTHTIKPEDYVLAAINPDNEDFNVTCFDDHAMWSRFAHIHVKPSKTEFSTFLDDKVKNKVIQTALTMSSNLYTADKSIDHTYMPVPDNRNLEKVAHVLDNINREEDIRGYIGELISGMIGFDAASVIIEVWYKSRQKVDYKVVLNNCDWSFNDDQIDEINTFNIGLVDYIKKNDLSKKEFKGLLQYVNFIPRDICVKLLKDLSNNAAEVFDSVIMSDHKRFAEMIEINS